MARIERFEDLEIWKEAVSIGVDIYNLTSKGKVGEGFFIEGSITKSCNIDF